MPVVVHADIRRLSQDEFAAIAYEVVRHAFDVQNDFGRLFDEPIYQQEIGRRSGGIREVPIEVYHGTFRKFYFLDLLVSHGAIFELKAVEKVTERHRAQLLHYLLLTGLPRGKLLNLRSNSVEHEFVNTTLTLPHYAGCIGSISPKTKCRLSLCTPVRMADNSRNRLLAPQRSV